MTRNVPAEERQGNSKKAQHTWKPEETECRVTRGL